jgi:hypothetical protein
MSVLYEQVHPTTMENNVSPILTLLLARLAIMPTKIQKSASFVILDTKSQREDVSISLMTARIRPPTLMDKNVLELKISNASTMLLMDSMPILKLQIFAYIAI